MMLLTRSTRGHSLGPTLLVMSLTDVEGASIVWTSFCGSYYKTHLSNNHHGTFEKQDLLLTGHGMLGHMACLGLHHEVAGRERVQTWGSACTGVEGGVTKVSQVYSLLVNLKHKTGN